MRFRIVLARSLIRAGRFVQSLAIMIMRPDDLIEFTRQTYENMASVEGWSEAKLVDAGLSEAEKTLLERVPFRSGKLLLLGVGGGREAVPLARMGFEVTGVDFIPALVEKAVENSRVRGASIIGLVQDISRVNVPPASYEIVWLTSGTYSSIPTRKRREIMLDRIREALVPSGYFLCQFMIDRDSGPRGKGEALRRIFSWLTLGNLAYEKGDRLADSIEFLHYFRTENEVRSEFEKRGFEVVELFFPDRGVRGGAVLKKVR